MFRLDLAAFVMFLSVLPAQKQAPGTVVEGELGTRLEAAVTAARSDFWGAVAVTQSGRTVLARGYGMADFAKAPCGPRSLFDLGTVGNQVTAAAALLLVRERKLALDQPLGRVLRDWPADKAEITVEHLLRHTSGLPPEADWAGGAANALRTAIGAVARCKLIDKPGRKFHFSHLNSCVLAMVIESASGARFERYVEERVLKACGMRDAAFLGDPKLDDDRMTLRRKDGGKGQPVGIGALNWSIRGARGLVATVLDAQAFGDTLGSGRLLDDAALQQLWTALPGGDAYSVGTIRFGAGEIVQVHGQTDGYRARLLVHRGSRTVIAVCSGAQAQLEPVVQALLNVLAAAAVAAPVGKAPEVPPPAPTVPPEPAPAPPVPAAGRDPDPGRFVGTFALPVGGAFVVERQGDHLLLTGRGLQASARVVHGAWPPPRGEGDLRRAEDRGLLLLEAMMRDERTAFGDAFVDDEASLAARASWDRLAARHGKPRAVALLGTELGSARVSWFEITFGETPIGLRLPWTGDRFAALRQADGPPPFQLVLQSVRADTAVGKTAGGQQVVVTLEGDGASRCLVFEDASPGAAGLLECPLQR